MEKFQTKNKISNISKLMFCVISLTLFSCVDENEKITGYLVAKEYTPERMCCDNTKTICYAGYVHVPRVVHQHHHSKQDAQYYWYLANKNEVIKKSVTSNLFYSKKVGTKITMKRY